MQAFEVECMYCNFRYFAPEERLLDVINKVLKHSKTCKDAMYEETPLVIVEEVN